MINFKIGRPEEQVDIDSTQITSLVELDQQMDQLIKEKNHGESIKAMLFPPIPAQLSIPLIFKALIKHHDELLDKEIKLFIYLAHEIVKDHLIKFLPEKDQPIFKRQMYGLELIIQLGDITKADTKAIVNASNNNLKLGGGVSGAIRDAANADMQIYLDKIASSINIQSGDAIITNSFGIPGIEKIIHVSSVEGTEEVINRCVRNALLESEKHNITSLAIPALGAGTGGLPMNRCAEILITQIQRFYQGKTDSKMKQIKIILWRKKDFDTFIQVINDPKISNS